MRINKFSLYNGEPLRMNMAFRLYADAQTSSANIRGGRLMTIQEAFRIADDFINIANQDYMEEVKRLQTQKAIIESKEAQKSKEHRPWEDFK